MKIFKFLKTNFLIILILLTASYFRFGGIYPSYPPQHPDEAAYGSAYSMMINGNLDPLRYDYPSGIALIQMILFKLIFVPLYWLKFYITHVHQIADGFIKIPLSQVEYDRFFRFEVLGAQDMNVLIWGRVITAFFGVGVVFLTYLLSKKLFGYWTGIASSFFVAVNFRQVLNSHIGLPDIYNAFFLLLAIYASTDILKRPNLKNYFLAGLSNAYYSSIKFQVFSFPALILVHFKNSWDNKTNFSSFIQKFFSKKFILSILLIPLITVILNPYHFLNFEKFVEIQKFVALKYGMGVSSLNLYAIWYLYNYQIGEIIFVLIFVGLLLAMLKRPFNCLILLSVILPFLFIFLYYSRGGFYTRNFVTITPLVLIFAGFTFQFIYESFVKSRLKSLSIVIILVLIFLSSFSNLQISRIIVNEYSKLWNIEILAEWVRVHIPKGSKVAAHSNVPLPIEEVQRSMFDPEFSASIDEINEEADPDYAVANFAWATRGFYWWMNSLPEDFLKFNFQKPTEVLEFSHPAIALREIEPYSIFPVFNPWIAPDTDFIVIKVPKFNVLENQEVINFDFRSNTNHWTKEGLYWESDTILFSGKEGLIVDMQSSRLPSPRWQSPPIDVRGWGGFEIDFTTQTQTDAEKIKGGFIYANFYQTKKDARESKNRIGVRVSSRTNVPNTWINKSLIGKVPKDAKFMTIGFYAYETTNAKSILESLTVYKADVDVDLGGIKVTPIHIDENNLFPNSHGNL